MYKLNDNKTVAFLVTHKHEQALRVYNLLIGRKCTVSLKQTRTRSLITIDVQ